MITENSRLRSEFLNTQVITRNTGKKLGVVKDILVDIDQRVVVAL
jgi:sporulation protein YlmC with PRC-barrel domain